MDASEDPSCGAGASTGSVRFFSSEDEFGVGDVPAGGGDGGEDEEAAELEVSLRSWLDRPRRAVDAGESVHIFRQVADAVGLAHRQGVVVGNARPSCLLLSPFARVAFIESASCSGSDDGEDAGVDVDSAAPCEAGKKEFPLKQLLSLELGWYTSPEEGEGLPAAFASDIYRLGVLLFELFATFDTVDEKLRAMANLRHRVLPPQLLLRWPKEASFCLWLLHPAQDLRPKMSEVLQSEFLNRLDNSLQEREEAARLVAELENEDLLLDFLLQLQRRKQEVADKLQDNIWFLSNDIEAIGLRQSFLRDGGGGQCPESDREEHSVVDFLDSFPLHPLLAQVESSVCGSRKRVRMELQNSDHEDCWNLQEASTSESSSRGSQQENMLSKTLRLMKNFEKLEAAYLSTRYRVGKKKVGTPPSSNGSRGLANCTEASSSAVVESVPKESCLGNNHCDWINPFLEGLCKYLSFSRLRVRGELKQCDLLNLSNLVCSLGFDRDKEFFATAGVNKKIKVFEYDMVLDEHRDIHYPVVEMTNRSKLSCICWNNYVKGQLASSDFDGIIQVWDVSRSQVFLEFREHQRRAWSVDFSLADPRKLASGSDDGCVKLWNINHAASVGTIRTNANVCSVQFHPDSSRMLAVGSADHNIYCYDLRNLRLPYFTLVGHSKSVSSLRYLDSSAFVSASTDNSLKLWDLSKCVDRVADDPLQTFTGHTNTRNFVGLSVSDGYIATGSETNEVYVYHKAFQMPVLSFRFETTDPMTGSPVDDPTQFVSSVCWRGQSQVLLAANSGGNIKILELD